MRPARQADFAIALDLLGEQPGPLAWANLGDWSGAPDPAMDYATACRQLALRVGRAAALRPGDRVLDLACGHGASLALWPQAFGVNQVSGLEYRSRCVEDIRRHPPAGLVAIAQGRFDTLPAPAPLSAAEVDAVVCVDAAYHARSLEAFAAFAAAMLRPRGRLAFTTLVAQGNGPTRNFVLARAGIPAASVLPAELVVATLRRQGFTDIALQTLDAEVLAGFHAFAQRRRRELRWRQQVGAGWLKIQATAWLCGYLHRSGALHYTLVSAARQSSTATAGRPPPVSPPGDGYASD